MKKTLQLSTFIVHVSRLSDFICDSDSAMSSNSFLWVSRRVFLIERVHYSHKKPMLNITFTYILNMVKIPQNW